MGMASEIRLPEGRRRLGPERTPVFYQGPRGPPGIRTWKQGAFTTPKKPTQQRRHGRHAARPRADVPVLPIVVGAVALAAIVVIIIIGRANTPSPAPGPKPAGAVHGIKCDKQEQLAYHIHVHLDIVNAGQPMTIPANIGIDQTNQCLYWLHTHKTDGVIHIEAPTGQEKHLFTLSDFFAVWGKKLDSTTVAGIPVGKDQKIIVIVEGQPYTGDPNAIELKTHEKITIEVAPPEIPQPAFTFAAGE